MSSHMTCRPSSQPSSSCFTPLSSSFHSSCVTSNRSASLLCLLFLCLLAVFPLCHSQKCDPCTPGGCSGLDLTSVAQEFSVAGQYEATYYVMLCKDDTSKCAGVVCKKTNYAGTFVIGTHADSVWTLSSSTGDLTQGAVLAVSGGKDGDDDCPSPSATINVTCGSGDDTLTLPAEGGFENCNGWKFELNSKYVCTLPNGRGGGGGGEAKSGLSGGSIFLILFFVGAFVYFVGGILFNKYRRGMTGTEVIPNIGFWRDLPGLVRDGCMFSFNKVRALCGGGRTGSLLSKGTGSTYETI